MAPTQESKHVHMMLRISLGIHEETITRGSRFISSVRRGDEEWQRAIHQLITHLSDTFTVSTSAVIHALT